MYFWSILVAEPFEWEWEGSQNKLRLCSWRASFSHWTNIRTSVRVELVVLYGCQDLVSGKLGLPFAWTFHLRSQPCPHMLFPIRSSRATDNTCSVQINSHPLFGPVGVDYPVGCHMSQTILGVRGLVSSSFLPLTLINELSFIRHVQICSSLTFSNAF